MSDSPSAAVDGPTLKICLSQKKTFEALVSHLHQCTIVPRSCRLVPTKNCCCNHKNCPVLIPGHPFNTLGAIHLFFSTPV